MYKEENVAITDESKETSTKKSEKSLKENLPKQNQ